MNYKVMKIVIPWVMYVLFALLIGVSVQSISFVTLGYIWGVGNMIFNH